MKKFVLFLICCSLGPVISFENWNAFEKAQNVEKVKIRAAKFNSLFWSPQNASEKSFTQETANKNEAIEGRELKPIHHQIQPIQTTALTKKSRTDESLERSVERKKHSVEDESDESYEEETRHKKRKHKKKFKRKKKFKMKTYKKTYKKMMMPLLIAYKLKFFTLIPIFIAGLVLLVKTAGLAGFFFALFSTAMALKGRY